MTPNTIVENNGRFTVNNARPFAMRIVVGIAAPIAIALVGLSAWNDVQDHRWGMAAVRVMFALTVALAALFSLFGAETIGVEGQELVWRRGSSQERRCALGDVEKLDRQGNQLWVHIRGEKHPIIVGSGLRQPPSAMAWLTERLESAITAARTGK
jgi:hypothetical protein